MCVYVCVCVCVCVRTCLLTDAGHEEDRDAHGEPRDALPGPPLSHLSETHGCSLLPLPLLQTMPICPLFLLMLLLLALLLLLLLLPPWSLAPAGVSEEEEEEEEHGVREVCGVAEDRAGEHS